MNIVDLQEELEMNIERLEKEVLSEDDYAEFEMNVSDGGNHSDTLAAGENYGHTLGELYAYKDILKTVKSLYD